MKKVYLSTVLRAIVIFLIICVGCAADTAFVDPARGIRDIAIMLMFFFVWVIIEASVFLRRYSEIHNPVSKPAIENDKNEKNVL